MRGISVGAGVLAVAIVAGTAEAAATVDRPNIIFILADDLGHSDLGCQGSTYYESPRIDRLAKEGMRFTAGYTCGPNCQPTRAALMSGQYGPRTGVYTVGSEDRFNWRSRPLRPVSNVVDLPLDRVTVAQSLKNAGYKTGMFGKWHLGHGAAHHPGKRGFEEAIATQGQHFNFKTDPPVKYPEGQYLADFLTDKAVDYIRRHKDDTFFLYLPHFGVHGPHQAKPDLIDRFKNKPPAGGHNSPVYAAMIASVDESVGRIVDTLEELGLRDKTLVIFSSDNGGVGGYRRAGVKNSSITDNAPLRGGKGMLYEGGVRVPYIFNMPGVIKPGSTNPTPIASVDLYPTLLEVAKGEKPAQTLDGRSYAKLLRGQADDALATRDLFWHFPGYLGASGDSFRTTPVSVVREKDWKLLEFLEDGRLELYNVTEDVGEAKNRATEMPERVSAMKSRLDDWRRSVHAKMPEPNRDQRPAGENDKPRKRKKSKKAKA